MKKKGSRIKKKHNREIKTIILILIISIVFLLGFTSYAFKELEQNEPIAISNTTYTGTLYSLNTTANFLDYLDNNSNIVMSPINANSALAILYNGTDNNSAKEIKKYFQKNPIAVNEELSPIVKKLNKKEQSKQLSNYEKLIATIYSKKYNTLKTKDIEKMTQSEKESLLLIIIKTNYYFNQKKLKLSNKYIEKYKLSDKEKSYNSYLIKEMLDKVLIDYEKYALSNSVNNYSEIFYNSNQKIKVDSKYSNTIKEKYNANITAIDYQKKESKELINNKVKERIIDEEITENGLIMINELSFNYKWQNSFSSEDVKDEEFNGFNDEHYMVDMMYSQENTYLENEQAYGFIKNFENNNYSFVGILPKDKKEYKNSELNIESLLASKKEMIVNIGIPKFSIESINDLSKLYANYKINEIFTDSANLHEISNTNLKVSLMIQKETINIGEYGTTESTTKSSTLTTTTTDDNTKNVILNRPFTFLIIDNTNNEVLLIGKVINPSLK